MYYLWLLETSVFFFIIIYCLPKQLCNTALIKKQCTTAIMWYVLPVIRKEVFDNYFIFNWLIRNTNTRRKNWKARTRNRHDYFYGQFHLLLMAHMGVSPPGSSLPVSHSCLHDRLPPCPCALASIHLTYKKKSSQLYWLLIVPVEKMVFLEQI